MVSIFFNKHHYYYYSNWSLGIEDEENWHGKALGDKAAKAIEEIKARIQNQGEHGLKPQPVTNDAPSVCFNAKLSEPPNYTLGQKVR